MYVNGTDLYIADTGNNRIVKMSYLNDTITQTGLVTEFNNGDKKDTLSGPQDVFVSDEGDMYIADTGNKRIVHLDKDNNVIKIRRLQIP